MLKACPPSFLDLMNACYDLAIIGGGINGCGIAAEAASRGLRVFLCEKDDFAAHTSSSSTKLIHGGLRYLEQYHFGFVRKSLKERETLLHIAPHLVKPIEILMPHMPSQRPTWLIRLGLFLYDHLGGHSSLPHSTYLTRKNAPQKFKDLSPIYDKGFCYFDAKTHDARLTLENALLAHQKGATILNYTKCERCYVDGKFWHLDLTSKAHGALNIRANFVINAAGPYIDDLSSQLNLPISKPIKKVKGSHIVVDQKLPGNFGYLLQHEDNRVIFVLPYHEHTLIGTTDVMFNGGLDQINIDDAEIAYLLACYNLYFEDKITTHDIINSWSGVRPLIDDAHLNPSDVSRDFYLDFMPKSLPLLNVLGGKLTTYRELSEEAIDKIRPLFPNLLPSMTHQLKLPGAQGDESFEIFSKTIDARYPKIKKTQLNRYIDTYGMRFTQFLNPSDSIDDLGENFGYDFTQRELDFLVDKEWARTLEDVLWRRTKLGLLADKTFEEKIAKYLLLKIKPLP